MSALRRTRERRCGRFGSCAAGVGAGQVGDARAGGIALFRRHREKQDAEREAARQLWHDEGWVLARPDGRPLNPNTDYHEWKELLREAGLRDARLHDARHTAATVLLILGVPTPTAMAMMGTSPGRSEGCSGTKPSRRTTAAIRSREYGLTGRMRP